MEQLLLVTSCDSPAGIGASLRTHTHGLTEGQHSTASENLMNLEKTLKRPSQHESTCTIDP